MPNENIRFRPRAELLTFQEIERFVRVVSAAGINKIRITGGEPLLRKDLPKLIEMLRAIPAIEDIAMTTNGILLDQYAVALRDAGLDRLNISLDTLDEQTFEKITRRSGIDRVLNGIAAAQAAGFENIRLNAIAIKGLTETEISPLARFAQTQNMNLRFIEFMPLDADGKWKEEDVLTGDRIREILTSEVGELRPCDRPDLSQPAVEYEFADGRGRIGLINSVSQPFCSTCNRLRLTAEGQVRNCLFSDAEWDVRAVIREGGSDATLLQRVREGVLAKKRGHGKDSIEFAPTTRAMYQIGG